MKEITATEYNNEIDKIIKANEGEEVHEKLIKMLEYAGTVKIKEFKC